MQDSKNQEPEREEKRGKSQESRTKSQDAKNQEPRDTFTSFCHSERSEECYTIGRYAPDLPRTYRTQKIFLRRPAEKNEKLIFFVLFLAFLALDS